MALGSDSRGTRCGTRARRMGVCAEVVMPRAVDSTSNAGIAKNCKCRAMAAAEASAAWSPTVSNRPLRGLMRSATMPNSGDSKRAGASIRPAMMPTQVAEWVRSQALQPSRKRSVQLPRVEKTPAGK